MDSGNFRIVSPSVYDTKNNKYLLSDSFSMNAKINHSNSPIIGGTFGLTLEDIDDLERNATLSGPILLHDNNDKNMTSLPKIGYNGRNSDSNICDLYYWINNYYVFYHYCHVII